MSKLVLFLFLFVWFIFIFVCFFVGTIKRGSRVVLKVYMSHTTLLILPNHLIAQWQQEIMKVRNKKIKK
jgi:hypothetical protein